MTSLEVPLCAFIHSGRPVSSRSSGYPVWSGQLAGCRTAQSRAGRIMVLCNAMKTGQALAGLWRRCPAWAVALSLDLPHLSLACSAILRSLLENRLQPLLSVASSISTQQKDVRSQVNFPFTFFPLFSQCEMALFHAKSHVLRGLQRPFITRSASSFFYAEHVGGRGKSAFLPSIPFRHQLLAIPRPG